MPYQVFISYRRRGGEALGYLIKEKLQAAGYIVFFDIESLSSGKFNTKLMDVIDTCNDVILILNPGGLDRCVNEDDWVRKEISYALSKEKKIIPIFMDGFEWPNTLPEDISELKYFNGIHVNYEFFDGFIHKLQTQISNKSSKNTIAQKELNHILVWGDFNHSYLKKIIKRMNLPEEYYIEILEDPLALMSKDLSAVDTIVLIDTDVTKLSNNDFTIDRINKELEKYVDQGGKLVATHDIIYRRTRNEALQGMFGCKIAYFKQVESVEYIKDENCNDFDVFTQLPDSFVLHDDEICWGDTSPDIDVYFKTKEGIPLVFSREYGKGLCVWLNSGDFKYYPSLSISKPESHFVLMLKEAILMKW